MSKYLIITKPGYYISIANKNLRSPCKVEIKSISEAMIAIRKYSIRKSDWKIINENGEIKYKVPNEKEEKRVKEEKDSLSEVLEMLKKQSYEINVLKDMIEKKDFSITTDQKIEKNIKKNNIGEEEEDFIPTINTNDIDFKESNSIKVKSGDLNLDNIVENLKRIKIKR